jgi:putative ABC transport system ATP-binding protein
MGPSGSGKSTLLNILGGLEVPTSGQLLLEGIEIGRMTDDERTLLRRRRIGFVFQQFNLLPIFSAVDNVALPLRLEGLRSAEAERRAAAMLDLVGLSERRNQLPSQLSGGEQQRVAIA